MIINGVAVVADLFPTKRIDERVGEKLQTAEDVPDVGLEVAVTSKSLTEATNELVGP